MRYWLTALVAASLAVLAGWFFLLNQGEVAVTVAPALVIGVPLGAALLAAFGMGAGVVGLAAVTGALARRWRTARSRRRDARSARTRETLARVETLVWGGETSRARAQLLRAPGAVGEDATRLALLAETHLRDDDAASALALLREACATHPDDPRLLDLLAQAAEALDDRATAIDAVERARRAAPASPRLAARLRDLYAAHGRWRDALAVQSDVMVHLRAPARIAAERDVLLGLRYEAALAEPDDTRAGTALRALGRETPTFLPAWVSAGDRYAGGGRSWLARRAWLRGLRHRPAVVLLERIAAHDRAANQTPRTLRLLHRLVRRRPDDPVVILQLARLLIDQADVDAAMACLEQLPESARPLAEPLRGEGARLRGDWQGAAAAFARALDSGQGASAPWRCVACGVPSDQWRARCPRCGRWDAIGARAEALSARASADLIRPAMRSQGGVC